MEGITELSQGYVFKHGDREWVFADAETVAQNVPAKVFRRAARIAENDGGVDFAQVGVMFSMLEQAAPSEAIEVIEDMPMARVAEVFQQWMEYKPDDDSQASLGE